MKKKRLMRTRGRSQRETLGEHVGSWQPAQTVCQKRKATESADVPRRQEPKLRDSKQPQSQAEKHETEPTKKPRVAAPAKTAPVVRAEPETTRPAPTTKKRVVKTAAPAIGREERYRIADPTAVTVEIEKNAHGEIVRLDAELSDISLGGVRLRSKTSVAKKDALTVNIIPKGFPRTLSARAQVCWTTPAPKGYCWLGCSIEPKIPQALLDHLAENGILERRHDNRKKVAVAVPACWELNPTTFQASIVNVSPGGICLSIPLSGNPGERIRLTLPGDDDDPTYVLTTVCWQVDTDNGYIVGCKFSHPMSYKRLLQLTDAEEPKPAKKPSLLARCGVRKK
jgi:hypothetical protein